MARLDNTVAIVTGGDSGIGHAISLGLAQAGAAVTINYHRNQAAAQATADAITSAGGKALVAQGDVSQVADLTALVAQTVQAFGRLDVMVNNAGLETRTGVLDTTEQQFDQVIGVDLKSAFFGTQCAARQMLAQGQGGRIINISSVHEDWPMPGNIAYCCAKGGMRMLTRTAGLELAPHGITVVGVGPGAVDTPINASTLADPQQKAQLQGAIPLGRVAEPDEIAHLVVWLASDEAAYMNATTVFMDGGLMQSSVGL
ncbi:MAG TPA: glucose 1-dehydrogenase [Ktedonobacterales bacterium]|nr:glucose 1-dehydrogenase [Ktedonobacterales bacterium]